MAAAFSAVRHNHKSALSTPQPALAGDDEIEVFPPEDKCVKVGVIWRQNNSSTYGVHWIKRYMALTKQDVFFRKTDEEDVLDKIPLVEISKFGIVSDPKEKGTVSFRGKSANQSTKNITALTNGNAAEAEAEDLTADFDAEEYGRVLRIFTIPDGLNSGRTTVLKFDTVGELNNWLRLFESSKAEAIRIKEVMEDPGAFKKLQKRTRVFYESDVVQYSVGAVILLSYITSILGAELQPLDGSSGQKTFYGFELMYTAIFASELAVNMFGNWFGPFFENGWNVFDFVVVITSMIALAKPELPAVNVLRLVRVFKMVRLFRKMQELRILINALCNSVVPVLYSFVIVLLISSIFAVLACDLFKPRGDYESETSLMFTNFSASLFTLFQVATGDSWASMVARELMRPEEVAGHGLAAWFVATFFTLYLLIVGVVLMNVVIAVLLDEFIATVARERSETKNADFAQQKGTEGKKEEGPLDSLVESLLDFHEFRDLSQRIGKIFQRLDVGEDGSISLQELNHGLRKISKTPRSVHLVTPEEYDDLTMGGTLSDENDALDRYAFEDVVLGAMRQYSSRKLSRIWAKTDDESQGETFRALQMITLNVQMLAMRFEQMCPNIKKPVKLDALKSSMQRWQDRCVAKGFQAWKFVVQAGKFFSSAGIVDDVVRA